MKGRLLPLLLALAVLLSACGRTSSPEDAPLVYYAVRSDAGPGQSAVRGVAWPEEDGTPTVETFFRRLTETPEDGALYTVFPENLRLLSWELEDGLLRLDVSEEYSGLAGISLTVANYCIVLTMSQLDGVSSVSITVAGSPPPEGGNAPRTAGDALLTGILPDPTLTGLQLYFPLADGSDLGTEYREVQLHDVSPGAQVSAVLEALIQGPASGEMTSPFEGLEVQLSCELVDEVCLLTLTDSWAEVLRSDALSRQALVNSLCELDGVEAVAFSWPGGDAPELEGTFPYE
ncbi:MAG TPA: GerMN domain-containing protein [Candidatus Onthomonas avicola]|nr:GerMN domain-containing protein [Candidatus Onthomonas avicola]